MLSVNSAMESGCVAATASGAKSADPEVSRELDLARLKGLRSTQRGKVTNLLKNLKKTKKKKYCLLQVLFRS